MLKVDTIGNTRKKILEQFSDLTVLPEVVELEEGIGRIVYEDIFSPFDVPEFNRSTVDGYAVVSKDTFGVSESLPVFLDVIDSVEMGKVAEKDLKTGQAIYVPTGGMIPKGADGMIMIEYVENLDKNTIAVYRTVAPGEGIIFKGEDIRSKELLIKKGKKLSPQDIGAIAAMGINQIKVFQKPRVAIISTGDEIVPPGERVKFGQIRDINTYSLGALIENLGGTITQRLLIADDFNLIKEKLDKVLDNNHIVLISGGSSVGLKDVTAKVIDDLGEPGVFVHGLAVKPGKPTIIGKVKNKAVFGLPGHPVSAMIICRIIVGFLINRMISGENIEDVYLEAISKENIHSSPGKETYQMVELIREDGKVYAQPIYGKSGSISTLIHADGFIRINQNTEGVNKGDKVWVIRL
ncbi:MAG TPA: molybdopterin molybdenumtransferase MoeA [Eubacteriaceae bacterium]|nr:molybdopterin molybdenumtransferase MoeA [Eubacteriaceae bacterium]